MKKVIFYEAIDGTKFKTEKECLEYDLLNSSMRCINKICERNGEDCTTCPYYSEDNAACGVMMFIHAEPTSGVPSPNFWKI